MASPCLQVVWGPEATDANDYLAIQFRNIQGFTSLNYRQPRLTGVFIENCDDLLTVTVPNCTTIEGYGNTDFLSIEPIQIGFCNSLTSISFPALTYLRTGAWITDLPALTTIDLSALVELDVRIPGGGDSRAVIRNCNALTSISLPSFTTITATSSPTSAWAFQVYSCPSLQSISIPNLVFPNGCKFDFFGNALTQASVDHILAQAVSNAAYVSGRIDLDGGTNATPSAGGLADKATLIGMGVAVNTN